MDQRRISIAAARAAATQAAAILARDRRVRLVYLFGSVADATCADAGDVDLALLTDEALAQEEILRLRADLVEATKAPIDLLSLNRAGVVLAHEVAESGRCLYARDVGEETDFVVRSRARYWDWRPFRDAQWIAAGARLEERLRGA
jgi:predicted nucleotidyltransferase